MNLYDILEIKKNASQEDIKKAYKKLCVKYHPDKNNGQTQPKFYAISTAYDILSDPIKKAQYDSIGYINSDDMDADSKNGYTNPFMNMNFDFSNMDPKIGQAFQFVTAINSLCSKIFNSDVSLFNELCSKSELDDLIAKNEEDKAQNYLYKSIKKHFNISLNNEEESETKYESDFSQSEIMDLRPSDIVINIDTNLVELYNGNLKIITFDRQCFKNEQMVIEKRTIKIPVCDDRVILDNEGNDYIDEDNKMIRGRVIINIKCISNKHYKRVNDYDIMISSHISAEELETGINKTFKYFNSEINLISKNPLKRLNNGCVTYVKKNLGITYYENNNIKEPKKGDLIIVLFLKKDVNQY